MGQTVRLRPVLHPVVACVARRAPGAGGLPVAVAVPAPRVRPEVRSPQVREVLVALVLRVLGAEVEVKTVAVGAEGRASRQAVAVAAEVRHF